MAEITAALVKDLREKSGVGMMDCKRALQETGGDMEAAIDWLRAKGLAKAAKKADRIAAEGVVAVAVRKDGAGMTGSVVELNAETDFVARNDKFQAAAKAVATAGLDAEGVDAISASKLPSGETVGDMVTQLIATIGENMLVRRAARFVVKDGVVANYVHQSVAPGEPVGQMGVLVAVEGKGDQAKLLDLGRKIAMHVAAFAPLSLSTDDLDPAAIDKERAIFTEQALASGKPAGVVEKMVEGRIRKFFEEVVLLKQASAQDPDKTIEQLVAETAKETGSPVQVTGFVRYKLGDGVEKKTDDFAAEVAELTGQS